jgi:hypothetical protein
VKEEYQVEFEISKKKEKKVRIVMSKSREKKAIRREF